MQLFVEEAREHLAQVEALFPRWEQDPTDGQALRDVRRVFHTLKGSGRMVGARRISEFAWSVESLLNRVISQTLARSPDIVAVVRDAIAALPLLIDELQHGVPAPLDVSSLMARADALSGHETVAPPAPELVARAPVVAAPGEAAAPAPVLVVDPILQEIFRKETAGHVAVGRNYLRIPRRPPRRSSRSPSSSSSARDGRAPARRRDACVACCARGGRARTRGRSTSSKRRCARGSAAWRSTAPWRGIPAFRPAGSRTASSGRSRSSTRRAPPRTSRRRSAGILLDGLGAPIAAVEEGATFSTLLRTGAAWFTVRGETRGDAVPVDVAETFLRNARPSDLDAFAAALAPEDPALRLFAKAAFDPLLSDRAGLSAGRAITPLDVTCLRLARG